MGVGRGDTDWRNVWFEDGQRLDVRLDLLRLPEGVLPPDSSSVESTSSDESSEQEEEESQRVHALAIQKYP